MTGRAVSTNDAMKDVLLAARNGTTKDGLDVGQLQKAWAKGWLQYTDESEEKFTLSAAGVKACALLKI